MRKGRAAWEGDFLDCFFLGRGYRTRDRQDKRISFAGWGAPYGDIVRGYGTWRDDTMLNVSRDMM